MSGIKDKFVVITGATRCDFSGQKWTLRKIIRGAKRVDLQLKRSPNSARRELAAPPILFSGFEIAPSFEVGEEGGLHGTPTEAFLS